MSRPARNVKPGGCIRRRPDPEAWRHVTRDRLADLLGVHPDRVSHYTRAGMPTLTRGGPGRENTYDAVACQRWYREHKGLSAKDAAQTRALLAQAVLNQERLRERRHQLVSRKAVQLASHWYRKAWTAMVRSLPRRFVDAGIIRPEQEHQVATLCRNILAEIASWNPVNVGRTGRRRNGGRDESGRSDVH